MNRNLNLHVTKEPTVVECEESATMFDEEWRETFVLPYEFGAKTLVDGAKISIACVDKIAECMEGSAKTPIGEERNLPHPVFKPKSNAHSMCAQQ
jgi:hypothetical protein